jgi:hypothetical protein
VQGVKPNAIYFAINYDNKTQSHGQYLHSKHYKKQDILSKEEYNKSHDVDQIKVVSDPINNYYLWN